jgi:hypothetical protein
MLFAPTEEIHVSTSRKTANQKLRISFFSPYKYATMKHIYPIVFFFLFSSMVLVTTRAKAQSSSTTAPGNCSALVQNFNNSSGGHASPSIYGGIFDSAFYYNPTLGYWTEMDGGRTTPAGVPRTVTIISPPYANPNPSGIFDVGFWYKTSNRLTDRFQVRLVQLAAGPGGTTVTNIVATSGVQPFTSWSTPNTYIDPNGNVANNGDTGRVCIRIVDADIITGPGIFYRVEIAYLEQLGFFAAYDNLSIGASIGQGSLPVNFIGIVANRTETLGINVRWDVGDEVDVDHYELERSTSGGSFTTVGTVAAKHKMVYAFTDPNGKYPTLYYRIKSVDLNGSVRYSGIVRITNATSFAGQLKSYPSPARSMVTLEHAKLGNSALVTINSMDGRVLRTIRPGSNLSTTMIDISALTPGLYIIRLDDGQGKIESTTIVKQ